MRWRIERDYQELKQEFGLDHYEGRGWRGFHHHAVLSIAAYGFLVAQRLSSEGLKKNPARSEAFALPGDYLPRGHRSNPAARSGLHRDIAVPHRLHDHASVAALPCVRAERPTSFMTQ